MRARWCVLRGEGWGMRQRRRGRELALHTDRSVTRETSHALMSSLKVEQAGLQPKIIQDEPERAQKTYDRSVTAETSHVLMWPYVAAALVGLAHHASRAGSSAARSAKACPGPCESRRRAAAASAGSCGEVVLPSGSAGETGGGNGLGGGTRGAWPSRCTIDTASKS